MAYAILLAGHSLLRWAVLLGLLLRCGRAWTATGAYTGLDRTLSLLAIIALDLQFVLGLGLYFGVSPATKAAMADVGAAMKEPYLRFWLVEHTVGMLAAVVMAHVANVVIKRREGDAAKHTVARIGFTVALVLVLAMIPWPFREALGRPLLPGF